MSKKKKKKSLVLLILDGWGIRDAAPDNAITAANPVNYNDLLAKYPHIAIDASGLSVGLPPGQIGNSEVGHMTMGAGRVVYQELTRINKSIEDGDFFENKVLLEAIAHAKKNNGTLHLMGLLSDGGVHSHIGHLIALLDLAKDNDVKKLRVHAFLDGRDVGQKSAEPFLEEIEKNLLAMEYPQIATVIGRYFVMDRDQRWDRVEKAYNIMVSPEIDANYRPFSVDGLNTSYNNGINDEFVEPLVTDITFRGMEDGDSVIFFNFRPDRAREITRAMTQADFQGFERKKVLKDLYFACMCLYDETFDLPIAYPKQKLDNLLVKVLSDRGMTQLRTAETEKYAHVTFFFNGGVEVPYLGEERVLVPSPKVATYDLQPEMSLPKVCEALVEGINSGKYDFIVANFANPDMVGHTGMMPAAVEAVKAIDIAIGQVAEAIIATDGKMLLTADHGNIEQMCDANGHPHTAHTIDLVPLVLVSNDPSLKLQEQGVHNLSNLAPTILDLFGIEKPTDMTSDSLLVRAKVGSSK